MSVLTPSTISQRQRSCQCISHAIINAAKFCVNSTAIALFKISNRKTYSNSSAAKSLQKPNVILSANKNGEYFSKHQNDKGFHMQERLKCGTSKSASISCSTNLCRHVGSVQLLYWREQHGRMDKDKHVTGAGITSAVHCYMQGHQGMNHDTSRHRPFHPLGSAFGCSVVAVLSEDLSTSPLG